jgi:hypothetical protein
MQHIANYFPTGPFGLPSSALSLSSSSFLILLAFTINHAKLAIQPSSTSASPVKHQPMPIFSVSGATTAAATAAAGLRNRLASATNVAGVFLKLSVRYDVVVMKTQVMPKAAGWSNGGQLGG